MKETSSTCPTCNFAATALALAPDEQARGKTAQALWQHLTREHNYTIAHSAQQAVELMKSFDCEVME